MIRNTLQHADKVDCIQNPNSLLQYSAPPCAHHRPQEQVDMQDPVRACQKRLRKRNKSDELPAGMPGHEAAQPSQGVRTELQSILELSCLFRLKLRPFFAGVT